MTRPISDLDVPLTHLQRQLRDLVGRQRKQSTSRATRSAERLQTVLAPTNTALQEEQS